ncbi:MAG: helix-turn-helix transcriptional regulator [Deltaproteobacteria bacterium]|nr:helix-turn-helix transcriptional regulator [Candidatus Zymogenaceae bacterium]
MKHFRESLNMTLQELALRTGIAEQRIRSLEIRTERPNPEEASKIADALNISTDELFEIVSIHPDPLRSTDLSALLDTIDGNARRFISDKEIQQLENALRLSIDAVDRLKNGR